MEQRSSSEKSESSESAMDFGWEDYTVNPGLYDAPKTSDVEDSSDSSLDFIKGWVDLTTKNNDKTPKFDASKGQSIIPWRDYTNKKEEKPETIDQADGNSSLFVISDKEADKDDDSDNTNRSLGDGNGSGNIDSSAV